MLEYGRSIMKENVFVTVLDFARSTNLAPASDIGLVATTFRDERWKAKTAKRWNLKGGQILFAYNQYILKKTNYSCDENFVLCARAMSL